MGKYVDEVNLIYIHSAQLGVMESDIDFTDFDLDENGIFSEVTKDSIAKKTAKARNGLSLIDVIKQGSQDIKHMIGRPNCNPTEDGNFKALQPWLMDMVKDARDMERIKYLRTDAYTGINSLNKLADNLEAVEKKNYGRMSELTIKSLQKRIDSGCTSKKVRDHIKWMKEKYIPAINEKAKEIKKSQPKYESYLYKYQQPVQEMSETEAALNAKFAEALGIIKGKDFTDAEIDRMIKEIEKCNARIDDYNAHPNSMASERFLRADKIYMKSEFSKNFWLFAVSGLIAPLVGGFIGGPVGIILNAVVALSTQIIKSKPDITVDSKLDVKFYSKLKNENNKALKYLRAKRRKH